jgi:hypothetical protein
MTAVAPRVAVVVVSCHPSADATTGRWSWLDECVVFDPARMSAVPTDADWLLLVCEDEAMHPGSAAIVREAVRTSPPACFALPILSRGLDLALVARRPVVRLAPAGTPIVLRSGLEIAFEARGREVRHLPCVVTRERGTTLTATMEWLGRTATTLAALGEAVGRRHGGVAWHALVAGLRVLTATSSRGRLGLGRLILAVVDAYRVVVAHAKLWERRRDRIVDFG